MQTLRMLQTLRPTPTAKIRASDVVALRRYDGTISSTIDVLTDAGLLIEDVPTRVEKYFAAKFTDSDGDPDGDSGALPTLMRRHLELWLQIMLGGSRQSPRQLPRDPSDRGSAHPRDRADRPGLGRGRLPVLRRDHPR